MIVTFYSYKGGVGRSMALANVAEILSERGHSVIVCDWDLEAPGLERYFAPDRNTAEALRQNPGIIDLLLEYKRTVSEAHDPASTPSFDRATHTLLHGVLLRRPSSYAKQVPVKSKVRLLPAGARSGEQDAQYTGAVQKFDWSEFYTEWAGANYIEFLRNDLDKAADFVLVDSRTGVTEHGGVCTHHLADLVLIFSAANDLNLDGARWMRSALQRPDLKDLRNGRPLYVLTLASRVEQFSEKEYLKAFRERFVAAFADCVPPSFGNAAEFLRRAEIPYVPAYSFEERVTARETERDQHLQLYDAYRRVADAVIQSGIQAGLLQPLESHARTFQVYLSHGANDAAAAVSLAGTLTEAGMHVWLDVQQDIPSTGWRKEIKAAVDGSSLVAFLVTKSSRLASFGLELRFALTRASVNARFRIVNVLDSDVVTQSLPELLRIYPSLDRRALKSDKAGIRKVFENVLDQASAAVNPGVSSPNPFVWATPFPETRSPFYCDRDSEIDELISKIESNRFVALVGDSGCGKTSLLGAGLVPALERGCFTKGLNRYTDWEVRFASLREPQLEPPQLAKRKLLIFDQFEQVFAPEVSESERKTLLEMIVKIATQDDNSISILIAVRPGHNASLAQHAGLAALIEGKQLRVAAHGPAVVGQIGPDAVIHGRRVHRARPLQKAPGGLPPYLIRPGPVRGNALATVAIAERSYSDQRSVFDDGRA